MRQESEMIEVLKQALDALEFLNGEPIRGGAVRINLDVEIAALRAAIAEAAMQQLTDVQQEIEQEPVAWMVTTEMQDGTRRTYPITGRYKDVCDACDFGEPIPLYTRPPRREWVGLTEVDPSVEQLDQIIDLLARTHVRISARELLRVWIVAYTRAIEAKLKEKNS